VAVNKKPFIHPYIPNSVPEVKKKMLAEIGVKDIEELYEDIPPELRLKRDLNLPDPLLSELELRRHMEAVLDQNISCGERSSFLGGGCARHYVPAICDEIAHRSEFLTAYAGDPYEDAGRFQALFEYESLMAGLLDFDEAILLPQQEFLIRKRTIATDMTTTSSGMQARARDLIGLSHCQITYCVCISG
jgi:glycine dehydrogenase subunit 1